MAKRAFLALLVAVSAAVGVSACGDDEPAPATSTASTTTPAGDATAGKEIFSTNCAGCHTLADAGATGTNGPNLDDLKPDFEMVQGQVTNGGGGMPAFGDTLSEADIGNVAAYVSSVAGT